MRKILSHLWILVFFLPVSGFAQNKVYPHRARTLHGEVSVFKEANFDSEIIATLPAGQTYDVSSKLFNGAFYRLRIRPGVLGYVSDVDVKPLKGGGTTAAKLDSKKAENKKAEDAKTENRKLEAEQKKNRPFQFTQYGGFQYSLIQFQEDTMGDKRQENLDFFGAKISGPNLILEGAIPTEMNFQFHYGAPSYYEKLTGKSADGFILLMDFLFQNYYPQSKNSLLFFGFGPMFRYSKFNTSLVDKSTGKSTEYSLEDMAFGGVLNAGVALRINRMALRGELKYYWESQPYLGAGVSAQFAF